MFARNRFGFVPLMLAFSVLVMVPLFAGCGTSTQVKNEQPLLAKDANGTTITIPANAPQRIVSLGATDSEILGALGVGARVIGVDAYTNYPADLAAKPKVSGSDGYPNVEAIVALRADLILGYGGETAKQDAQLMQAGITVVDLPALDLKGSLTEMLLVGQLVHAESAANALVASLQKRIDAVKAKVASAPKVSVYMEADDYTPGKPYVFGKGSFGDELIADAGGVNVFGNDASNAGYPQVSDESIIAANPQVIVLTDDPKFGGDAHAVPERPGWSVIAAVQSGKVYGIDPDLMQRAGPRIVDGLEQLAKVLHPELFS